MSRVVRVVNGDKETSMHARSEVRSTASVDRVESPHSKQALGVLESESVMALSNTT